MITGLFVWGDFDFSLSLLTSYRFVQIFCFFFSYFCSLCVHRNVCFIQVVFCAGLSLFIITVIVGLVLGFCYLTKFGSPPPLGVKPIYWNRIVVKENAVFMRWPGGVTHAQARGGGREDQPHVQGAVAALVQEGQEELSHIEGQEGRRWGDTPRPR